MLLSQLQHDDQRDCEIPEMEKREFRDTLKAEHTSINNAIVSKIESEFDKLCSYEDVDVFIGIEEI